MVWCFTCQKAIPADRAKVAMWQSRFVIVCDTFAPVVGCKK
jgi:hypothetical protein